MRKHSNRLPWEAVESPSLETFKTHLEALPFSLALDECPGSARGRVNFCSGHEGHSQVILYQLRPCTVGTEGCEVFPPRCAMCALRWHQVPCAEQSHVYYLPVLYTLLLVSAVVAVNFISLLFLINSPNLDL